MPYHECHPLLGKVIIQVRANARQAKGSWERGHVKLTVPPFTGRDQAMQILDDLAPRLLEIKPPLTYRAGQRLDFDDWFATIDVDGSIRGIGYVKYDFVTPSARIVLRDPLDSEEAMVRVGNALYNAALTLGKTILKEQLRALAARLGVEVGEIAVRDNRRNFGSCSNRGKITLASRLMFLPRELREYVMSHEMAHLCEFNHSARFHRRVNELLAGREKELDRCLKSFVWPVFR